MAITGLRIYAEMQGIRAADVYPDEEVKAELVERTFPKSAEEMTLKLSNVSAAFYGLLLAQVGDRFGWREADAISKSVFRRLGQLKTKEALELGVDLPKTQGHRRSCSSPRFTPPRRNIISRFSSIFQRRL
jgi:hypothetical protein